MSSIKEERDKISGAIIYINFSGYYEEYDECKEKPRQWQDTRVPHMDTHKEGDGGKIQAMGTSHYFIVHQVALLGVSDNCVKKNCALYP